MPKLVIIAEPGKQEIVMTRLFDAPREFVFKAYTDPKLIPQWWGRTNSPTTVDRMEVRQGGRWRFVARGADGIVTECSSPIWSQVRPRRWTVSPSCSGTCVMPEPSSTPS
jgi:uncharacterized protein YndB with AHSA1/START domain